MTESDPRGGWWISEDDRKGSAYMDEDKFFLHHMGELNGLAADALTARIFGLTCGSNFFNESSASLIRKELHMYVELVPDSFFT
jgi:hypothetical protein